MNSFVKNLNTILSKTLKPIFPKKYQDAIEWYGIIHIIPYFYFQTILGINYDVPWPVHWSSLIGFPKKISRGKDRFYPGFAPGQYIQAFNGIQLGKNLRMAPGVKIISANHDPNDYDSHIPGSPIIIGDNCLLSANCVILPGVKLGNHTIVAAGAIVTKSFEESNVVIGGVPAKILKKLNNYSNVCEQEE